MIKSDNTANELDVMLDLYQEFCNKTTRTSDAMSYIVKSVNYTCSNRILTILRIAQLHMLVSRMTSNDHRSENSVLPAVPRQRYNLYQRNNNKD